MAHARLQRPQILEQLPALLVRQTAAICLLCFARVAVVVVPGVVIAALQIGEKLGAIVAFAFEPDFDRVEFAGTDPE